MLGIDKFQSHTGTITTREYCAGWFRM